MLDGMNLEKIKLGFSKIGWWSKVARKYFEQVENRCDEKKIGVNRCERCRLPRKNKNGKEIFGERLGTTGNGWKRLETTGNG